MVESPNNIACSVICVCPHYNLVIAPDGTNMHERGGENGRSKNIEEWGQSYPFIYSPDYYVCFVQKRRMFQVL